MNRMIFFILASVLSLSFFTFTEATAEEKIWVSSTNAKLKADHSAASETVTRVAVGSELLVLSFENRWYHVSTVSGKKGWIYRGKVSNHPPDIQEQKKENALGEAFGDLGGSSIRADAADGSRSIRGLSAEAKEYARKSGKLTPSEKALDAVLSSQISNNQIEHFLKAGRIGEYAE
ncbi:SH3 domain-containing protein [Desulfonema magnum]|uniref:SH3 domain-containing protein n=1 Tax=Desulfonema magnum TaxID=45655 RepID=A0A975BI88_9BACT|nr:SH3 domain-containing protein [Desulfonema magnum]QTA86002.1 SH3 domain-containing protein [Desulfonema magnum]